MHHQSLKRIPLKAISLTLGLAVVGVLGLYSLDKNRVQRQPETRSENKQRSIPVANEKTLTSVEYISQTNRNSPRWQSSFAVNVAPPERSPKSEKSLVVSVKDFGAIGNGLADDTIAIQKAIDAVHGAGGGVVFFPSGTYQVTINPKTSQALILRPKLTLRGEGADRSTLKLGDHQGNYQAILAGERSSSDLSDFAMYDLAIDANSDNNPILSKSDLPADKQPRYALQIFSGRRIHIERCQFTNQNNMNTITLNSNADLVSDGIIKNNTFERIGGGDIDYDHSTIFTYGKRMIISDNHFVSRNGAGTNGARTAIEIHGDDHLVKDNVIDGFTNGINITGYAYSSKNQSIVNNVIKDAYTGMTIWSFFHRGNKSKPALENCLIANNEISLNIKDWRKLWGDTSSAGIWLDPRSDAPIHNLNILNNKIIFTNFADRGRVKDNRGNGINLWRASSPKVLAKNMRVLSNQIQNSLAAGIYISMSITQGEISKNTILNPGQSKGDFHEDYRAAMIVDGTFNDVQFNENLLIDNQETNTMKSGIIWFGDCEANCEVIGNSLQIASSASLEVFRAKSPRLPLLDRVSDKIYEKIQNRP